MHTLELLERREVPAAFTPGNLVVLRTGGVAGDGVTPSTQAGATAIGTNPTAIFIDEYTTGGALVQTLTMTPPSGRNFTMSASSTSEGDLQLSADGRFIIFTGFDAAPGLTPANVATSSAATVNRGYALINTQGVINYTYLTDGSYDGGDIRSAMTTNGTDVWLGGTGSANQGVRYTTRGSASATQLTTTVTNIRRSNIFDGQLFTTQQSGGRFAWPPSGRELRRPAARP